MTSSPPISKATSPATRSFPEQEVSRQASVCFKNRLWLTLLASAIFGFGCDRGGNSSGSIVKLLGKPIAELRTLAQLPPNQTVHIAVDSFGNVVYTRETDDGADGAVVVPDSGIPRATQLTSANILAALGETVGGAGAIQDLIAGQRGVIWFYFVGGKGKTIRACIGQYLLRDESIRVVFDTDDVLKATALGDSIELARGQFIAGQDRTLRLLLRHSDAWKLLTFRDQPPSAGERPALSLSTAVFTEEDQPLDLTNDALLVSAGKGNDLLLLDLRSGALSIADGSGKVKPRVSLIGLPKGLSAPLLIRQDHLLIFASDSPPIETDQTGNFGLRLPQLTYPALLEIDPADQTTTIARDDLHVPANLPAYALRISRLVPITQDSFIAYDAASGQLLNLQLKTLPP